MQLSNLCRAGIAWFGSRRNNIQLTYLLKMSPLQLILVFALPGFLQGFALHFLGDALDAESISFVFLVILIFVVVAPVANHLTTTTSKRGVALVFSCAIAVLLASLTAWTAARYSGSFTALSINFYTVLTTSLCSLVMGVIAIPFFRSALKKESPVFSYASLFEYSWELFICLLIAFLFSGLVTLILLLSIGLFLALGISLEDLIFQSAVLLPIHCAAFGLAIGISRSHVSIIHSTRHVLLALLNALLPIFAIITALFIGSAFFKGLDSLETGFSVTLLLITSIGLAIVLCNGAIRDSAETLSTISLSIVRIQALVLPVLAGFAIYGLYIRISEYGLTHVRVLSILVVAIASIYAAGYCLAAFTSSIVKIVQRINIILAIVCFFAAGAVITPLLDPHRIAVNTQVKSLMMGQTSIDKFDFKYLRFDAGFLGTQALAQLKNAGHDEQEALNSAIAEVESLESHWDEFNDQVHIDARVAQFYDWVDSGSVELISTTDDKQFDGLLRNADFYFFIESHCQKQNTRCVIVQTSAFSRERPDYLVATKSSPTELAVSIFTQQAEGDWAIVGNSIDLWMTKPFSGSESEIANLMEDFSQGKVPIRTTTVRGIVVGEKVVFPGFETDFDFYETPTY